MAEKHIVTIDLGTEKLGVSVAVIDDDQKLSVVYYDEFASDGIKHSRVSNPKKLAAKLKEVISQIQEELHIHVTEVMVNVQRYGIRQFDHEEIMDSSDGRSVSEADISLLNSMVMDCEVAEDERIISCIAQSYDLDDDELNVDPCDVVGMNSRTIKGKYKVYALKKTALNNIETAFRECGVNLVHTVFVPDLIGAGVLSENEMQSGVALIDLGAGASSVSIFQGGVLRHYGSIPFGGNNITVDIQNVCGISLRLAENIKMAFGGCMPHRLGSLGEKKLRITNTVDKSNREVSVKYLSEIITAREGEILNALLYDIQQSGYADKLKSGVIVTGGGASMLNICHFIKDISGYNAKVAATSRDRFEADSDLFFNVGASMSCGLLRKYSLTDTMGCEEVKAENLQFESITEIDEAQVEAEVKDKEESANVQSENGSLFADEEMTIQPEEKMHSFFSSLGKRMFNKGGKKETRTSKEKVEQKAATRTDAKTGFDSMFGEDEDV